jgi:hypothetical protein
VHNSPFIRILIVLVGLMIISCSFGSNLSTPRAVTSPAASLDSDGDRVADANDNCPLTPNSDQADANANGLGDVCDAPFQAGFAYSTPQGVVQSLMDERQRPQKIVAPDGTITFAWSEDASRLDLVVDISGESIPFTLKIDLSDAALLAALDAAEAGSGQDMSTLRAWIAEHPGQVQAVASGEQPPPRLAPTPSSSLPAGKVMLAIARNPAAQNQPTDLEVYIRTLADLYFLAEKTWLDFKDQHPEMDPGVLTARYILEHQANALNDVWLDQWDNCMHTCTAQCSINCGGEGEGACFLDFPQISPCFMYLEQDCATIEGAVFYHGQTCPGACWVSAGGVSNCTELDEKGCQALPGQANIPGHGFDMSLLAFCPGQSCFEPMCISPVP